MASDSGHKQKQLSHFLQAEITTKWELSKVQDRQSRHYCGQFRKKMLGVHLNRETTFWEMLFQSSNTLQELPKLFNVLY